MLLLKVNTWWRVTFITFWSIIQLHLWKTVVELSDIKEPFKLQNGWLLWAGVGLFGAIISIALAGAAMTYLNGETPEREVRQNICFSNWTFLVHYHTLVTISHTSFVTPSPFQTICNSIYLEENSNVFNHIYFLFVLFWLLSSCGTLTYAKYFLPFIIKYSRKCLFLDSDWFTSPFVAPDWLIHYQVSCILPLCSNGLVPLTGQPKLDLV